MSGPAQPGRPRHNSRRAKGEGSIYWRESRQRFEGSLSISDGGRRVRRTVTGASRKHVADELRKLRDRAETCDLTAAPLTVAQLAQRWWASQFKPDAKSQQRARMVDHIINDAHIGPIALGDLRPRHVTAWLAHKANTGYTRSGRRRDYSRTYLNMMRGDLHLIVEWAVREEWMARNPVAGATIPLGAPPREIKRTLTVDQAHRLIETCLTSTRAHANFTLVMLLTGCRPSEVAALMHDAVDVDNGIIHIHRAITRDSGGRPVAIAPTTKTHHDRAFTVSDTVLAAIRREQINVKKMRLAAGPNWCRDWDGLIFLTCTGRPAWSSNIRRSVRTIAADADIEIADDLDPYELRHSCASLLAHAGVAVPEIIGQLGHRDDRVFWQHYFHRADPVVRNAGIIEGMVER